MDLEKKGVPLECSDIRQLLPLAQKLVDSDGFGNGRDVVTCSDRVHIQRGGKKYQEDFKSQTTLKGRLAQFWSRGRSVLVVPHV
jgi:hypothetical protein